MWYWITKCNRIVKLLYILNTITYLESRILINYFVSNYN